MIDIVKFISFAFDNGDSSWLSVFLLSEYATAFVLEKAINEVALMNFTDQTLIDQLFEAHMWHSIHKPTEETCQDEAFFDACFSDRIDLIERMLNQFKRLSPDEIALQRSIAIAQGRKGIQECFARFDSQQRSS